MVGKLTTQGDRVMRAQVARRNFHLDGRGIKIGVISDSFNALNKASVDVANGDLPGRQNPLGYKKPVQILKDLRRGTDEGRAMLQIISDIAPAAELLFHTAYISRNGITEQSFARAVKTLARAGADIIVDDVGIATTLFQDGFLAQTVTEVVNQGVAYFSAVGNDSNRSYESVFRPSTTFTFRGITYEAHDFDPGDGVDLFQDVNFAFGSAIQPLLSWDQPVGKVSSDLELFLVPTPQLPTSDSNPLAVSTTLFSNGLEQPLEQLFYRSFESKTAHLVIARKVDLVDETNHIKWISTANDNDSDVVYEYLSGLNNGREQSTIYGQPNARGAVAVGAVSVNKTPLFGINPPVLEDFSTRGGTPILFDPQGNRLTMPDIRLKPELVAPSGVSTTLNRFNPFSGTSAAAPHAAAVAALLWQRAGGPNRLSPAQLTQTLQRTAIPLDPAGNFRSGAGLVQADAAVLEAYRTRINGTDSNNRLRGNKGADNIFGFSGRDRLSGASGFDALFGGTNPDHLNGNAGNDYLLGGRGNDVLIGGQDHDVLLGNQGRDRLLGSAGDDLLAGGAAINWLTGGQGENTFVLAADGLAVIRDFKSGDQLALSDRIRFPQLQFSSHGSDLIIQWRGNSLARLIGVEDLSASDFTTIAIRD
jgi:subtilisin family serine protease